jgi:cell division protease FtsH
MAVLLGGRVAEEIVFNEISTGASNDLERVGELARNMVRQYGMSDTLGPVGYEKQRQTFLQGADGGWPQQRSYSEDTARTIDREVREMVAAVRERTRQILSRDRILLDRVALALLDKEVVTREELREIMGEPAEQPADTDRPDAGHGGEQGPSAPSP